MKIVFAGHNPRGAACLRALVEAGHGIALVLVHRGAEAGEVGRVAANGRFPVAAPGDVNAPGVVAQIRDARPDVVILVGYSQIVREPLLTLTPHGCLNLHAGKLPEYRGSSPLNWALINGERDFTLSIIQVESGVDTGDVLLEQTFPIGPDDTIADLHTTANSVFPELLIETLRGLETGGLEPRRQDERKAGYYPLRFPDDGLIVWDLLSAEQVHNRIRALTDPYPCAFTYHQGRRLKLLASRHAEPPVFGEPGRIYRVTEAGLLVCAADRCLWVQTDPAEAFARYDCLLTARWAAVDRARET